MGLCTLRRLGFGIVQGRNSFIDTSLSRLDYMVIGGLRLLPPIEGKAQFVIRLSRDLGGVRHPHFLLGDEGGIAGNQHMSNRPLLRKLVAQYWESQHQRGVNTQQNTMQQGGAEGVARLTHDPQSRRLARAVTAAPRLFSEPLRLERLWLGLINSGRGAQCDLVARRRGNWDERWCGHWPGRQPLPEKRRSGACARFDLTPCVPLKTI